MVAAMIFQGGGILAVGVVDIIYGRREFNQWSGLGIWFVIVGGCELLLVAAFILAVR